jgi:hypothetical protein
MLTDTFPSALTALKASVQVVPPPVRAPVVTLPVPAVTVIFPAVKPAAAPLTVKVMDPDVSVLGAPLAVAAQAKPPCGVINTASLIFDPVYPARLTTTRI